MHCLAVATNNCSSTPRLAFAIVQHQPAIRFVAIVQILDGLIRRRRKRLVDVQKLCTQINID